MSGEDISVKNIKEAFRAQIDYYSGCLKKIEDLNLDDADSVDGANLTMIEVAIQGFKPPQPTPNEATNDCQREFINRLANPPS